MKFIQTILFFLFANCLVAQSKFTISGFVTEKGSKESLPGVMVFQPGTTNGTSANPYGFFSLTLPAADSVDLVFSYTGYKSTRMKISMRKDQVINVVLSTNELDEVEVVTGKNEPISEDVRMSRIDIPVEKIKEIPALFGEKDALKVLQLMPGVQKGSEGSSGFYVRGGGPDQNLIILDDATVYNAFHLFGFFSLFNGDALKSIELTKGGFPARYGGRLSSVLDMQMKDGNKEKVHGEAGIGVISSRLTIEGPLFNDKCSFLVSGRRTYIDALIYPFLPPEIKGGYYFYDLNAKLNYVVSDKDKLFLSGYFGNDQFYSSFAFGNSKFSSGLGWGNATATMRWNHVFGKKLFSNASLIFTDYKLKIEEGYRDDFSSFSLLYNSGIRDYSFKMSFDYMPGAKHYVKYGIHGIYHRFTPGAMVVKSSTLSDNLNNSTLIEAWENAAFIEDDWKISKKWRLNAGVRVSNFIQSSDIYFNPEPRGSIRYLITDELSLKGAYSQMNQYMHLLSNTGIGLPTDLWVPATKKAQYMTSQQVAFGLAKDFRKKGFDASIEGYYKEMNNVLNYKEGASFLNIDNNTGEFVSWENNVTSGRGWSYGAEFLLRKNTGKLTGWIGYTLSWTELQFDELNFGKKFYARYDRRHDVSVVGVYKLNKRISLSLVWVYGTGNAITLPLNTYDVNSFGIQSGANINQSFLGSVEDFGQQRNAYRMGAYHRLDLGIQFSKKLKYCTRVIEISVYNAYNRHNPFYYFVQPQSNGSQQLMKLSLFPIIPSFSYTWKF